MKTFLGLLAFALLCGCEQYESSASRKLEPNPMGEREYNRLVDKRTEQLVQRGTNPFVARAKAEDEADSVRFERSVIPQDNTSAGGSWQLEL